MGKGTEGEGKEGEGGRRRRPPTTTNRHQPPFANRQPPPTMVEHMECPRAFLGKLVPEHFLFSVKDRPEEAGARLVHCSSVQPM